MDSASDFGGSLGVIGACKYRREQPPRLVQVAPALHIRRGTLVNYEWIFWSNPLGLIEQRVALLVAPTRRKIFRQLNHASHLSRSQLQRGAQMLFRGFVLFAVLIQPGLIICSSAGSLTATCAASAAALFAPPPKNPGADK